MDNQQLKKVILEVIDTQIKDNNPPETKKTLIRLQENGYPEEEAIKLIGYVVASEVFAVFREDRRYDENSYIAALKALPKLPWEKEG
jgi:hypothetical protein